MKENIRTLLNKSSTSFIHLTSVPPTDIKQG